MSSLSHSVYTIQKKIIEVIKNYVFGYTTEICANLVTDEKNNLFPYKVTKGTIVEYGKEGKHRGTCNHHHYDINIIHTHPPSSYAYPSTEDILKVIKHHGTIVNSLIGTKWGIWVISNTSSSNIYSESQKAHLFDTIKKYLDIIGLATKTSDEQRKNSVDKSRDLTSEDHVLIAKNIKALSKLLMVKIDLYSWSDLTDELRLKGLTD